MTGFRWASRSLLVSLAVGVLLWAATGRATAATFVVTTTADGNNGACTVSLCTLRDAVIAANAAAGADIITLPAGTYTLTIAGQNEDLAATGDLDITGALTINGAGQATTIVDGGALDRVFDIHGATVIFNDLTVRNGLPGALAAGGGIANDGTLTLNNCTVSGNHTNNGDGAGIWTNNTLTLNSSTISGNVGGGGGNGGGIENEDVFVINNSTISGNSAGPNGGNGAGIYNNFSGSITNSTISGNIGAGGGNGPGIYHNGTTLTITGSTISGNSSANGDGGGIYNSGVSLILTNCTISGNTSFDGGGVFHIGTGATILDTTIASNTATNTGGGIDSSSSLTLTNTIVANNSSNCGGTTPINGGTNLQFPGATCGAGIPSANPVLGPLANNGGLTQTHALLAGSAAIDAGTTGCPPIPATDQRGIARPQGAACDVGSFELQGAVPTATPTPTGAPTATATPAGVPTATPTPIATGGVVVPTLSLGMLALLGLLLAAGALVFLRR